ncbi:uncharacterized protein LOC132707647 [Cylas formicarius]|uniref:uncharacterized protein LOC132707647 n=1 Tax=Cylas formicarius TaxID=197179 RepID=UPI0029586091|nr:uncharacterized protein LOC132707647 [Cylas formicarius]
MATADLKAAAAEMACALCGDRLRPPIRGCVNGHAMCPYHFHRDAPCDACGTRERGDRIVALDNVYALLPFRCKFADQGCPTETWGAGLARHEAECRFHVTLCPFSFERDCGFRGTVLAATRHCLEAHPDATFAAIDDACVYSRSVRVPHFLQDRLEGASGPTRTYVFLAKGTMFRAVCDVHLGTFWFAVAVVGRVDSASRKFEYEIDFYDARIGRTAFTLGNACRVLLDDRLRFVEDAYVVTDELVAMRHCDLFGDLHLRVRLFEIVDGERR